MKLIVWFAGRVVGATLILGTVAILLHVEASFGHQVQAEWPERDGVATYRTDYAVCRIEGDWQVAASSASQPIPIDASTLPAETLLMRNCYIYDDGSEHCQSRTFWAWEPVHDDLRAPSEFTIR